MTESAVMTVKDLVGMMVEGRKEGVMQGSGNQDVGVGESSGDDGTMCLLNVPRNECADGGGLYKVFFCEGNGAGGEKDVEPQIYYDNYLPA